MPERKTRIEKLRTIMEEGYYSVKVEGKGVDAFSASAYVGVYNALNEENQAKLEAISFPEAMGIVWKVIARTEAKTKGVA